MTATPSVGVVTPIRRGTIASRYLEAISCRGSEDFSTRLYNIHDPDRAINETNHPDSNNKNDDVSSPPRTTTTTTTTTPERLDRQAGGHAVTPIKSRPNFDTNNSNTNFERKPGLAGCSMTASTAPLDQSESWTTNGTKSQKTYRIASRTGTPTRPSSGGSPSRQQQRWTSTSDAGAVDASGAPTVHDLIPVVEATISATNGSLSNSNTPTSTSRRRNRQSVSNSNNQYLPPPGTTIATSIMNIEDDDDDNDSSSIESASTHGMDTTTPHLSIEIMETTNLVKTPVLRAIDCSSLNMASVVEDPAGSSSRSGGRSHHQIMTRPVTPTNHSGSSRGSASKRGLGLFPKTNPPSNVASGGTKPTTTITTTTTTPTRTTTTTDMSSPYRIKRTAIASASSAVSSVGRHPTTSTITPDRTTQTKKVSNHDGRGEEDDDVGCMASEAGAPTEVMTNRSHDIMTRGRQKWVQQHHGHAGGDSRGDREEEQQQQHHTSRGQQQQQQSQLGDGLVRARKALFESGLVGGPPAVKRKRWLSAGAAIGELRTTPVGTPTSRQVAMSGSTPRNVSGPATQGVNRAGYTSSNEHKEDNGMKQAKEVIPSLLDSQSTMSHSFQENVEYQQGPASTPRHSGSTSEQDTIAWNTASRTIGVRPSSSLVPPASTHTSRLSLHVQRARETSILSPSASETTQSMPSVGGVNNQSISSVKAEAGSSTGTVEESRDGPQRTTTSSTTVGGAVVNAGTGAGLRQVGMAGGRGQHALLSTHYRRAKLTVRGAQQMQLVAGHASPLTVPSAPPTARTANDTHRSITPDPIIGSGDCRGYDDDDCGDDEESTLPEYNDNRRVCRTEEFVVYNKRAKQNAGDVFLSKGTPMGEEGGEEGNTQSEKPENGGGGGMKAEYQRYLGSGGGGSPIQPLFSLDRLDLSVNSSPIRQARSRSMPPEPSRRVDAISPQSKRKRERSRPDAAVLSTSPTSVPLDRKLVKGTKKEGKNSHLQGPTPLSSKQEFAEYPIPRDFDDDDSLVEEELVHIMERSNERGGDAQLNQDERRPNSAPSYQSSRGISPSLSGRPKTPVSSHARLNYVEFHERYRQRQEPYRPSDGNNFSKTGEGRTTASTAESKMVSQPIGDKFRAFDSSPPHQWKRSSNHRFSSGGEAIASEGKDAPVARVSSPATKLVRIHTIRRYKARRDEEEKKEDSIRDKQPIFLPDRENDTSVKSLRHKLERISAQGQKIGDRGIGQDDDDNYSVQSLREKYEQKVGGPQNEDEADDDERSVKSLREIFESPAKPKGDNVNSLRVKFEPKITPKRSSKIPVLRKRNMMETKKFPEAIQPRSIAEPQISSSELQEAAIQNINNSTLSRKKPSAITDGAAVANPNASSSSPLDTDEATVILLAYKGRSITRSTHGTDPKDDMNGWNRDEKVMVDSCSNYNHRNVDKVENSKPSAGKPPATPETVNVKTNSKPPDAYSDESNRGSNPHSDRNDNGTSRKTPVFHSIHSRLNQWASRRQLEKNPALASQAPEEGTEVLIGSKDIQRMGPYDMTPVVEDQVRTVLPIDQPGYVVPTNSTAVGGHDGPSFPASNGLLVRETKDDSQSEDDSRMIPGSHWTSKVTSHDHREMPKVGDPKGASTDSESSDAVTLDASIAEVSLLTNPSPIRSNESKDSQEGNRQSDDSSSSEEKESEASSSQLSEAAAPLMSDSMPIRSDELSSDGKVVASKTLPGEVNSYPLSDDRDEGRRNSVMAFFDREECPANWQTMDFQSQIPFKSDVPNDHFRDQKKDCSQFADSNWPDFGDTNSKSRGFKKKSVGTVNQLDAKGTGNAPSPNIAPGFNPDVELPFKVAYQDSYSNSIRDVRAEVRREMPNRPQQTELATVPVQTTSGSIHSKFDDDRSQVSRAASRAEYGSSSLTASTSSHYRSRTPTRGIELYGPPGPVSGATGSQVFPLEDLANTVTPPRPKSPYRPRVSDNEPKSDFGPSQKESSNRNQASPRVMVGPSPQMTKPPVVPPLPSTFDPDYEAIMESRHKMLLSRQRALQHRRTTRERSQPTLQSGFFGRTHPERTQVASLIHEPSTKVTSSLRKPLPSPIPSPTTRTERPSRVQSSNFAEHGTSSDWDPFSLDDAMGQRTFEQITRPSHRPRDPEGNRWSSLHSMKADNSGKRPQSNREQHPSLYSKIKSRLGMNKETREMTQSEAVVARIAAVRAARMRRSLAYGENDSTYRQRQVSGQTLLGGTPSPTDSSGDELVSNLIPGFRFYTHDDLNEPVQADDFSFSTNSNAQEYAARLTVD